MALEARKFEGAILDHGNSSSSSWRPCGVKLPMVTRVVTRVTPGV